MTHRVRVKVDPETKEAFKQTCELLGANMSEVLRGQMKAVINKNEEIIPDDVLLKAKTRSIKDDARPYQQAAHLPNNFYEDARGLLDKRYPLPPDEVMDLYVEPYEETIRLAFDGEKEARKVAQLYHVFRTYEVLHPETDAAETDVRKACIDFGVMLRVSDGMDAAKSFVQSMIDDGVLRDRYRDEVWDEIRQQGKMELQARWKDDWDESIRPEG